MASESELAQFRGRGLEPLGKFPGTPVASKKQSGLLLKSIMKAVPKLKRRTQQKRRNLDGTHGKTVERDSSVHGTHKGLGNLRNYF